MFLRKFIEIIYGKIQESNLNISFGFISILFALVAVVMYLVIVSGLVQDRVAMLFAVPLVPVVTVYIISGSVSSLVEKKFRSAQWFSTYFPAFLNMVIARPVCRFLDGIYYGFLYFYIYSFLIFSVIFPVYLVIYVLQG